MKMCRCPRVKCAIAGVFAASLLLLSIQPVHGQSPTFVIGSSNTVTADPPVPRPQETPCIVPLFSGFQFVNFNIQTFQFAPPGNCPGPWEKIVFTADFNVTAGRQFDRTAIIDLGYVNIYFGTTPEPRHNLSPSWHVERDETEYAALFSSPQTGHVILGNIVNGTYTGVISGSAQLEFYQAQRGQHARPRADAVLPLTQPNAQGGTNEPAFLFTSTDQLATTFTLPQNIEHAYLDVITQSQINDEFWYSCVPNDVATELQSCGSTAFREAEISIDGQPAGVAPVYPWIYTGGLDPFLWEPVPGVQALNFVPYRVDLTPFAGFLSNGQPHTIALSVYNADSYFSATATLLVYLDHGAQRVTGEVTENAVGNGPTPAIDENLHTDSSGNITGTVKTASSRTFSVAGFANTSHGRVDTKVSQKVNFKNVQDFTITGSTYYVQDISQETEVQSITQTRQGLSVFETLEAFDYPLKFNYALTFAADGSASQVSNVSQEFKNEVLSPFFASFVDNKVDASDTLNISASGTASNSGAQTTQSYSSFDTRGQEYSCTLTSANNVLTAVSDGCGGNR